MRSAVRFFALMSVYCLVFAETVAHGTLRAGMIGASIAYAFAVLHLAIARWGSRDEESRDG
jgi:hypothetical protein